MRLLAGLLLLAALPAFGQGSMTLSWTPPTANTDGSPLTNLAGYKVYWGTSQTSLSSSRTLNSPSATGTIIEQLSPATWYAVVTAFNAAGAESDRSNVASKTIAGTPTPNPSPVTLAGPVFNLLVTNNSLVMPEAGSVVAGKPCDRSQQIAFGGKIHMRVDVSQVTPFPGQQILAAWAVCQ